MTAIRRPAGQYQACLYSGDCYQKNNWTIPGLFVLGWLLSEDQLDNTKLVCTRVTAIRRTTGQYQACLYSGDCYQKNNWTIPSLFVLGWLLSEEQLDNTRLVCTRVTAIRRPAGQYQACLYSGDCYQKTKWTIPSLLVLGWLLSEEQLDNTRLVCTLVTAIKRTTGQYQACLYSDDCYQKTSWTIPSLFVLGWLLSEEQLDNTRLVCTRVTAIRRTTGQYQASLYSGYCYQKNNWTIPS